MGCCGHRRKVVPVKAEQKWDYINLQDFRSKGCGTPTAYVYLWVSLLLSVAVYAVDTFTAVNLLVFDKWSSDMQPAIDFNISKYIFSVCIIASIVNLAFEWVRAARVMKRGNIAECYLDNLAVRWESVRMGSGKGFRRFLIFAELTKSKKGAEYIALFTYFSFQSWIRVLLCTGPRQVVNAFTLKAVYESDLLTTEHDVQSSLSTFFLKLQALAASDYQQTLILSGMAFTVVVWVFSLLFLLAAVLFYVLFLFHWIPRDDGGLTGYCERKVNKALLKIVAEKVNKALEKGWNADAKPGAKAAKKKGDDPPPLVRAATLPTIPDLAFANSDKLAEMPSSLGRTETMATLPVYTSRPPTPGGDDYEMSPMDQRRRPPERTATVNTMTSYNSKSSSVSVAADMGYSTRTTPAPRVPPLEPPYRSATSHLMRSMAARNNNDINMAGGGPPLQSNLAYAREYTESPVEMNARYMPPVISPTSSTGGSALSRTPTSASQFSGFSAPTPRPFANDGGRASTGPSMYSSQGGPNMRAPPVNYPGYLPARSATNPMRAGPALYAPQLMRSMTSSVPPRRRAEEVQALDGYLSPPLPERSLKSLVGPRSPESDYWNSPQLAHNPTSSVAPRPQGGDHQCSPQPARGTESSAAPRPQDEGGYYRQSQPPMPSRDRHARGPGGFDLNFEGQRGGHRW